MLLALLGSPLRAQVPFAHNFSIEQRAADVGVPLQMAVDASGTVYMGNGFIDPEFLDLVFLYRLFPDGTWEQLAQRVSDPDALAIGPDDEVYIGGFGGRIRHVDKNTGSANLWLRDTALGNIDGLEFYGADDLYVVAFDHAKVHHVSFSTKSVTELADLSGLGFTGLTGILRHPANDHLYISAPAAGTIVELDLLGNVTDPSYAAGFTFPGHLEIDPTGAHGDDIFVADNGGGAIFRIDFNTKAVETHVHKIKPLTGGLIFDHEGHLHFSREENDASISEVWRSAPMELRIDGVPPLGPLALPVTAHAESGADVARDLLLYMSPNGSGQVLPSGRFFPLGPGQVRLVHSYVTDANGRGSTLLNDFLRTPALRGMDVHFCLVSVDPARPNLKYGITSAVTVSVPPNQPPVAEAGDDRFAKTGFSIPFDGSASSDADGDALEFLWDPGDGRVVNTRAERLQYTYEAAGSYTASLTVDDGIDSSIDPFQVVVEDNTAPVADAGPDVAGRTGFVVTIDGSGSFDPDGDPLFHEWDPGDGSPATTDPVLLHTYQSAGTYTATLTVDDSYETAADTATVTVTDNSPPVADAGGDQLGKTDWPVSFDGSASSDADGDPSAVHVGLRRRIADRVRRAGHSYVHRTG